MALVVISTHLYPLENAVEHHTDRFELIQDGSTAIFRRGQSFYFGIKFNRPFDKVKDIVRIVFVTGERKYKNRKSGKNIRTPKCLPIRNNANFKLIRFYFILIVWHSPNRYFFAFDRKTQNLKNYLP